MITPDAHDRDTAAENAPECKHVQLSVKSVIRLGVIMAVVFGLIFVFAYIPRSRRAHANEKAAEERKNALPRVDVVAARRSTQNADLELPGTTTAEVEAPIYARASGYVAKRYADIGDRVKAGQLLARIDAPDLDQQVDQARASLKQSESVLGQTQAQLKLASVTWERYKVLVARGVLSRQDGDTQQANYEVAEANVRAAENTVIATKANLDRLLKLQGYERVEAPFTGIVTARDIDVGSLISVSGGGLGTVMTGGTPPTSPSQGGSEMFRVARLEYLRVFVNVPEAYTQYISSGMAVELRFDTFPQRAFAGKVVRTANAVDPVTRTLLTEVHVDNKDGLLLPGAYVIARFAHIRAAPPVVVPSDSVIARADGTKIAVVRDGVAHVVNVRLGRDYGSETEILSGINVGDQVIVNPSDDAREGAKVSTRVLKESGATGATGQSGPAQGENQNNSGGDSGQKSKQ